MYEAFKRMDYLQTRLEIIEDLREAHWEELAVAAFNEIAQFPENTHVAQVRTLRQTPALQTRGRYKDRLPALRRAVQGNKVA
jgi:hypothetical protein